MGTTHRAPAELLDRNLPHGVRPACPGPGRVTTYAQLAERACRAGNALKALGVQMEQRVMICMLDCADFAAGFWGAMKAGIVPVPINTLLTPAAAVYRQRDSRAPVLVLSAPLLKR